jgi:hypothetical protein
MGRLDDDCWRGLGCCLVLAGWWHLGARLEGSGQVGEADLVARSEDDRAGQALAVDERAAGGIQVADRDLARP